MTQYNISDCYNFDEIVHIKGNVYAINEQVKQDFFKCAENKLPCGYAWTEFDPTDFLSMIASWNKEGQASTGNIYQRVTDFGNLKPQLITHIIISDVFKKSGFDQKILKWRSDPDNETDVIYDPKDKSKKSKELIVYTTIDALQEAESRRRNAIRKMTKNEEMARDKLDLRVPTVEMLIHFVKDFFSIETPKPRFGCTYKPIVDIYELCARFGKTIFALCCFIISGKHTLVFTAYYQSAFASIKNEVSKWSLFSNIKIVDARLSDAKNIYRLYRKQGYKVVVICGIHKCNDWEKKYKWVRDIKDKIVIGDEVDFGFHTKNTSARVKFLQGMSYLLALSGTGADKMTVNFKTRKHRTYTMEQMLELKDYIENENKNYEKQMFDKLMTELKGIV